MKRELPLFSVSHNPLVNEKVCYVIVHHRDERKRATIRAGDWKVLEGEITEALMNAAQDWYYAQYLQYFKQ